MSPDPWLSGHDPTPGIVSVHAELSGQAWVWRRTAAKVVLEQERFRPWMYVRDLTDLQHLGSPLARNDEQAPFSVRDLPGSPGSLKYLLTAQNGIALRQAILKGAS